LFALEFEEKVYQWSIGNIMISLRSCRVRRMVSRSSSAIGNVQLTTSASELINV
jgi:hypothetical protein